MRLSAFTIITLLLASCSAPAPAPPGPPRVVRFGVEPARVKAGEAVTLTAEVERADELQLVTQDGRVLELSDGTARDVPLGTTLYVLRALGPGGRESAFAQVIVDAEPAPLFLVAVPGSVESGETATLVWSAVGAETVTLRDDGNRSLLPAGARGSGTVDVTPSRTTRYTLSTETSDGARHSVVVEVRPRIVSFTATPPAARPGETMTLEWNVAGAEQVALREATFGPIAVDPTTTSGSARFTVPGGADGGLDGGGVGPDLGFPLRFVLTASTPTAQVERALSSVVGDGPRILEFEVPAAASAQSGLTVRWKTLADSVELLADGLPLSAASGSSAREGTLSFPAPLVTTAYTLVSRSASGLEVRQTKTARVVRAPSITHFTVPPRVNSAGTPVMVSWETQDATFVLVRVENGPALFTEDVPLLVRMGMTSLALGASGTLVLEASNDAGDVVRRRARLEVQAPVTASVAPTPAPANVDLSWTFDFSTQAPAELLGVPLATPQRVAMSQAFVDLEGDADATRLSFSNPDEDIVSFRAPRGFIFPFVDEAVSTFWVSTNGFINLPGASAPIARPTNLDLATTTTVMPPMLAPLWDNLRLGRGEVSFKLVGASVPRTLVIQYTRVEFVNDPGSELTFQVQLHESGTFRFVYRTLRDGAAMQALGQAATVGVFLGQSRFRAGLSFNTATLAEGLELQWFSTTDETATLTSRALTRAQLTPFYRTATGQLVATPLTARVFGPRSVVVSEAMPLPPPQAPQGQYLELFNPGADDIDVGGLVITVSGPDAGAPFTLPDDTRIGPGAFLVLGESAVRADNGDIGVDVTWPTGAIALGAASTVSLRVGATEVSSLAWGPAPLAPMAGVAVSTDPRGIRSTGAPEVCVTGRSMTGAVTGTPGRANDACAGYAVSSIPVAFDDVSAVGRKLFDGSFIDLDNRVVAVTLSPAFRYFGTPSSAATIGTNGFLAMTATTATGLTNKALPSTLTPRGTIAPFWDDLHRNLTASDGSVYLHRRSNHHVVQWHRMGRAVVPGGGSPDDLNFEAKLFDDGSIEFHYATMRSGTSAAFADGNSATVWVEHPTQVVAVPLSINAPAVQSNTAFRFTPVP